MNRGDRIRTCDLVLPKHPRYQAAPRPVQLSVAGEGCGLAALVFLVLAAAIVMEMETGRPRPWAWELGDRPGS